MWNSVSAAATFSASSAAAINDSNSDKRGASEEEVSSDLVVSSNDKDGTTTDEEDDVDDDNDNNDLESIVFCNARDIQNRMSRVIGTVAMEDRRFHELFGASIGIILHVWYSMDDGSLLPDKCKPKHLLWTLYFLKVYPREAPGCSTIGGGGGGINPKTLQKWVWLFIERIAKLADEVVSIFL
jgi:hypothetical protein